MLAVVAGFYIYARYRVHRAIHDLPARLGGNIQQNTEGFTYSQAEGGHTIFSISAANAVRYKQGGKAELHKVKIISYGRDSDRLDEISGDEFEYDAQSGDIVAKGKVAIQLQATQAKASAADADAKRVGSPMHLETSGLVFNQKTGIARTNEKITFELPQGNGSALGATYESKNNIFSLHSDIRLITGGPKPVNMHADTASFVQEQQQITLTGFRAESGVRRLEAQRVVVHLRNDNTVDKTEASGGVNARIGGVRAAQLHSENASFTFGKNNQALSGQLHGGVTWETGGTSASHGKAGQVLLAFGANNQIKSAQLRQEVEIAQFGGTGTELQSHSAVPPLNLSRVKAQSPTPNPAEFHGDGLDLQIGGGSHLERATSVGAAAIVLGAQLSTEGRSGSQTGKTVITAGHFEAKFSPDNRLSTLAGSAPVKIVSSTPGQPDRISESEELLAAFAKGQTQRLEGLVQTGNVQLQEGQRFATADRATYTAASDAMMLDGNVHYKDASSGATLSSHTVTLNRGSGETSAEGDVKTTYAEQKTSSAGAMLSAGQPVHVTAAQMVTKNSTAAFRYSGGARLWQGGNIIQSPVIVFDRNARSLDARGQGSARVSTVFVQPDKNGREAPVEVMADRLRYDDAQRKAVFEGSVVLRSADSTLQASRAAVTLKAATGRSQAQKSNASASQVQSIDATGNILLEQPSRRASGARLLYTADEGKFVLTGTPGAPPSIFDAEHGQVTGVSLTFYSRDGRVLVDSSNSVSISQTRLQK